MNIYEKINEWLATTYQPLNEWLYFNATPMIVGTVAMNSVSGDRVYKRFVDGSVQRRVIFAIDMVLSYDDAGTSDVNMNAINEVNKFSEWIEEQLPLQNVPDFGKNRTIESIEVLTNVPSLLIDNTNRLAKYQFQARIEYKDESEVIKNG